MTDYRRYVLGKGVKSLFIGEYGDPRIYPNVWCDRVLCELHFCGESMGMMLVNALNEWNGMVCNPGQEPVVDLVIPPSESPESCFPRKT